MTFKEEYMLAIKNDDKQKIYHLKNLTRWKTRTFLKRRVAETLKCQLCNSIDDIVCHHIDYCEPYLINILCSSCHKKVHSEKMKIDAIDLTKLKLTNKKPTCISGYCKEREWLKEYLKVNTVKEAFKLYGYNYEYGNYGHETWRLIMTTCYKPGKKLMSILNEKFGIPEEMFDLGYKEWKINELYKELDKLLDS